jgi:hypothetical protein
MRCLFVLCLSASLGAAFLTAGLAMDKEGQGRPAKPRAGRCTLLALPFTLAGGYVVGYLGGPYTSLYFPPNDMGVGGAMGALFGGVIFSGIVPAFWQAARETPGALRVTPLQVVLWILAMLASHPWTHGPLAAVVIGVLGAVIILGSIRK